MSDSYCMFVDGELWVKNLHINEYFNSGHKNHEPKRSRKLLLNRIELNKIESKVKEKGMSIIPLRLYSNEKGKGISAKRRKANARIIIIIQHCYKYTHLYYIYIYIC